MVDLALAVVDESPTGFADLTLAAVAARAGVAVPSLYKHVRSLGDLRREVALVAVDELTAVLEAAGRGWSGSDALAGQLRAIRDHARRHPGRYAATQMTPEASAAGAEAHRAAAARTVAAMAAALGTRSATPPTKDDELVHRVRTVRSAVHGFVSLELSGGFGLPQDIDESFEHLISTLVTGLRLTPAAAAARTEPVA